MKTIAACTVLLVTSLIPVSALAIDQEAIKFPAQKKVDGTTLTLNGTGIRKATIFNVKVYKAGLYLNHKSPNPVEILQEKSPKHLEMVFLKDLSADKLRDSWKDGFAKNCGSECAQYKPALDELSARIRDAKEGDRLEFDFTQAQTGMTANGKKLVTLPGGDFGKILLSIWLGDHPPDKDLKEGMLGKKVG